MLTPHDIVVLLGLVVGLDDARIRAALGSDVDVDHARSVARLSGLFSSTDQRVFRRALYDVLASAGRFVYPAVRTGPTRGVPSGLDAVAALEQTAPGLRLIANPHRRPLVWPSPEGSVEGTGILPLHPGCVNLPAAEPRFYEAVALMDELRAGSVRERARARELFDVGFAVAA